LKQNPLSRFVEKMDTVGIWIAAVGIIFTMFYVAIDVLGRLIFKVTIGGGTEALVCLITVWVGYMSLTYTTKTGGHVAMSFFSDKLYGKKKLYDEIFISLITLIFFIFFTYASLKAWHNDFVKNTIVDASFSFKLRLWWGEIAMPIGTIAQIIASLSTIVEKIYCLRHGILPEKTITIQDEVKMQEKAKKDADKLAEEVSEKTTDNNINESKDDLKAGDAGEEESR